jgi:hypothetical protein
VIQVSDACDKLPQLRAISFSKSISVKTEYLADKQQYIHNIFVHCRKLLFVDLNVLTHSEAEESTYIDTPSRYTASPTTGEVTLQTLDACQRLGWDDRTLIVDILTTGKYSYDKYFL